VYVNVSYSYGVADEMADLQLFFYYVTVDSKYWSEQLGCCVNNTPCLEVKVQEMSLYTL